MNKKVIAVVAAVMLSMLTACQTENTGGKEMQKMVDVEIQVPESVVPSEEQILKAIVTQEGETVDDADKMDFEVWKANDRKNSEWLEGRYNEDGYYENNYTFKEDGVYFIQAHVTARELHVMPVIEMEVGTVTEEMRAAVKEDQGKSDMSGTGHDHHH